MEARHPCHRRPRRLVLRGHRRRWEGRCPEGGAHGLRLHEPAAHGQRTRLRPRQLGVPGPRRPGGGDRLQGQVRRPGAPLALPREERDAARRRDRPRRAVPLRPLRAGDALGVLPVRPRIRRRRPLLHARQLEPRPPRGHRRPLPEAQPRPAASVGHAERVRPRRGRDGVRDHQARRVRDAERAGPVHLRLQPDVRARRAPGRGPRPLVAGGRARAEPRAPRRGPGGAPRPWPARRTAGSSSPRPTRGSAPSTSRRVPTGALVPRRLLPAVIEHPEWGVTHHHHDSPDLYRGSDRGRIYGITVDLAGRPPLRALPGDAPPKSSSACSRTRTSGAAHGAALLVDATPEAPDAATSLPRARPPSPLHALWTLEAGKWTGGGAPGSR